METSVDYSLEKAFIISSIPTWSSISPSFIHFRKLSYGHSRIIFEVTSPQAIPPSLLFRKFHSKNVFNQKDEELAFKALANISLAPKLYACSSDLGRIEEFIPFSAPIEARDINTKRLRRLLALILGKLHKVQIESFKDNKVSFIESVLEDKLIMNQFKEHCSHLENYPLELREIITEIGLLGEPGETEFIRATVHRYPWVLSHNDIWTGNILAFPSVKGDIDVIYIDYEAMNYNFQGYDLAKLILECVFERPKPGSPEHKLRRENFPSDKDIDEFIWFYLLGNQKSENFEEIKTGLMDEVKVKTWKEEMGEGRIYEMIEQVRAGLVVITYYCAIIGLFCGKKYESEMDFIQFSIDNFEYYKEFKEKFRKEYSI